jgi:hypothetical protein
VPRVMLTHTVLAAFAAAAIHVNRQCLHVPVSLLQP